MPRFVLLALTVLAAGAFAPAAVAQQRTIEHLSAGETGGNGETVAAFAATTPDGTRTFFETSEALVAGDTDTAVDVYQRAGATLTLITPGTADAFFAGASDDGSRVFFETLEALASPDTGTKSDVYERSAAGVTLISGGSSSEEGEFRHASADGSRVLFATDAQVIGTDNDGGARDLYERTEAGYALISGGTADALASFTGASDDGVRAFFTTPESLLPADTDTAGDVYERAGGVLTLVSGGTANVGAGFQSASADGTRVLFKTSEPLVVADGDNSDDIYENVGGAVALVSGGSANVAASFAGSSADGSRVFFTTTEVLLPGVDTDTSRDIYERSAGALTLVSGGTANTNAFFRGHSADGSRVFFETDEALLGGDTDLTQDVYERSGGSLTLVSAGSSAGRLVEYQDTSADGSRVFFRTDEALVTADSDTSQDIYERFAGSSTLITGGSANADVDFMGTSADGSRVFFATDEKLAASDTDTRIDVYLSRPVDPVNGAGPGPVGGTTDSVPIGGGGTADKTAPVVSKLAVKPRSLRAAARGASIAAAVGARASYALTEPAAMRFTVERARPGRRAGRRCAAPTRRNRRAKKCTRYVVQRGNFAHQGALGANNFGFTGRLARRKLPVGSYRLVGVPTDAAGNRGRAARAPFRIAKR